MLHLHTNHRSASDGFFITSYFHDIALNFRCDNNFARRRQKKIHFTTRSGAAGEIGARFNRVAVSRGHPTSVFWSEPFCSSVRPDDPQAMAEAVVKCPTVSGARNTVACHGVNGVAVRRMT